MASSKTTSPRFALPDSNIRTPGDGVSNGFLQQEIMSPCAARPLPGPFPREAARTRGLAAGASAARGPHGGVFGEMLIKSSGIHISKDGIIKKMFTLLPGRRNRLTTFTLRSAHPYTAGPEPPTLYKPRAPTPTTAKPHTLKTPIHHR